MCVVRLVRRRWCRPISYRVFDCCDRAKRWLGSVLSGKGARKNTDNKINRDFWSKNGAIPGETCCASACGFQVKNGFRAVAVVVIAENHHDALNRFRWDNSNRPENWLTILVRVNRNGDNSRHRAGNVADKLATVAVIMVGTVPTTWRRRSWHYAVDLSAFNALLPPPSPRVRCGKIV